MRITGIPRIGQADRRPSKSGGADFSLSDAPQGPRTAPSAVQPATSLATLVALAEVQDEKERRRRLAADALRGLDALEALDGESDANEAVEDRLTAIAAWSAGLTAPNDPELARLQREIELRAHVELAKRRRDD